MYPMNIIQKYFLTIIVLGLAFKGFSQENKEVLRLSITEAQDYALQNNRSVKAAKTDIGIIEKQVKENLAIGLPQFNMAGNYLHQFVVPELSFGQYLDVNSLPDEGYLTKQNVLDAYKDAPSIPLGVANNTTFDFTVSQLILSGEYLVGFRH
jgi:outer membrane protein